MPAFSFLGLTVPMLDVIKKVRDELCLAHKDSETFTLQQIAYVIQAYTKIDEIKFVGFNVGVDNPIWGEFRRYVRAGIYEPDTNVVEVRYANHLDIKWRRFVVCKELCHALDPRKSTHTASNDNVTSLITDLSLISATTDPEHFEERLPLQAEKVAEAGAMELLIPLVVRQDLVETGEYERLGIVGIAERFRVPEAYVELVFRPTYLSIIENVFSRTEAKTLTSNDRQ